MLSVLALLAALALPAGAAPPEDAMPVRDVAVLAGGCFWGMEAVFERLRGVSDVESGFAGGSRWNASYRLVSLGVTDHAEAVRIAYDPRQITFEALLDVYFSVAHDPTELNRQGPDHGRQYRSAIFYQDEAQKAAAEAAIGRLEADGVFARPVVTTIVPFEAFYPAGPEHQDYLVRHPTAPYIVVNDLPKLERLEALFPDRVRRP
jgi:peptide-methionine (S)-S-oxide reductase